MSTKFLPTQTSQSLPPNQSLPVASPVSENQNTTLPDQTTSSYSRAASLSAINSSSSPGLPLVPPQYPSSAFSQTTENSPPRPPASLSSMPYTNSQAANRLINYSVLAGSGNPCSIRPQFFRPEHLPESLIQAQKDLFKSVLPSTSLRPDQHYSDAPGGQLSIAKLAAGEPAFKRNHLESSSTLPKDVLICVSPGMALLYPDSTLLLLKSLQELGCNIYVTMPRDVSSNSIWKVSAEEALEAIIFHSRDSVRYLSSTQQEWMNTIGSAGLILDSAKMAHLIEGTHRNALSVFPPMLRAEQSPFETKLKNRHPTAQHLEELLKEMVSFLERAPGGHLQAMEASKCIAIMMRLGEISDPEDSSIRSRLDKILSTEAISEHPDFLRKCHDAFLAGKVCAHPEMFPDDPFADQPLVLEYFENLPTSLLMFPAAKPNDSQDLAPTKISDEYHQAMNVLEATPRDTEAWHSGLTFLRKDIENLISSKDRYSSLDKDSKASLYFVVCRYVSLCSHESQEDRLLGRRALEALSDFQPPLPVSKHAKPPPGSGLLSAEISAPPIGSYEADSDNVIKKVGVIAYHYVILANGAYLEKTLPRPLETDQDSPCGRYTVNLVSLTCENKFGTEYAFRLLLPTNMRVLSTLKNTCIKYDKNDCPYLVFEKAPSQAEITLILANAASSVPPSERQEVISLDLRPWPVLKTTMDNLKDNTQYDNDKKLDMLCQFLHHTMFYSLDPELAKKHAATNSTLERMQITLQEQRGGCFEASTLMYALATQLVDCPVRLAGGFDIDEKGFEIAHQWVECFVDGRWKRYEATPHRTEPKTQAILDAMEARARKLNEERAELPLESILPAIPPTTELPPSPWHPIPSLDLQSIAGSKAGTHLVLLETKDQALPCAVELLSHLDPNKTFYLHDAQTLLDAPFDVMIDPQKQTAQLNPDSPWLRALHGGTLVINYAELPTNIAESLNGLFDNPPKWKGVILDPPPRIIGICPQERLKMGHLTSAWASRFQRKDRGLLSPTPKLLEDWPKADLAKLPATAVLADAHHASDWKTALLGHVALDKQGHAYWEKGSLLQAIESKKYPLVLANLPADDGELIAFLSALKLHRSLDVCGVHYELAKNVELYLAEGILATDLAAIQKTPLFHTLAESIDTTNTLLVNSSNVHTLFETLSTHEGRLVHHQGLLAQRPSQPLLVTSALSESDWHRILSMKPSREIICQDPIRPPALFGLRPQALKNAQPPRISDRVKRIQSSDLESLTWEIQQENPTNSVIDVHPDMSLADLVCKLDIQTTNNDKTFEFKNLPAWESLQAGGVWILRGLENNPTLQQELASLLNPPHEILVGDTLRRLEGKIYIAQYSPDAKRTEVSVVQTALRQRFPNEPALEKVMGTFISEFNRRGISLSLAKFTQVINTWFALHSQGGVENLFEHNIENTLRASYVFSPAEEPEFTQDHTRAYCRMLKSHRTLFLQGPPGTGKSHTARLIAEQRGGNVIGPITVGSQTTAEALIGKNGPLAQLAEAPQDAVITVILDEINLAKPEVLRILDGLLDIPPHLFIEGKQVNLSENIRFILTGNGASTANRPGGIALQRGILTANVSEFTTEKLVAEILLPTVVRLYPKESPAQQRSLAELAANTYTMLQKLGLGEELSPRAMIEVLLHLPKDFSSVPSEDAVAFVDALWQVFSGRLNPTQKDELLDQCWESFDGYEPGNKIDPEFQKRLSNQPSTWQANDSSLALAQSIKYSLDARQRRMELKAGPKGVGQPGYIVQGPPGRGKDVTMMHVLDTEGVPYVHINADTDLEALKATLRDAQEKGKVVIISEANLLPADVLDALLNGPLSGVGSDGEPVHPGFMAFLSMNPGLTGRELLSSALKSRCVLWDIQDYNSTELKTLLNGLSKKTETESDTDSDVEKIVCYHFSVCQRAEQHASPLKPTTREAIAALKSMEEEGLPFEQAMANVYGLYTL